MKSLNSIKNNSLRFGEMTSTKALLAGLGLSLLAHVGNAQNNTSYTGNSVPILGVENTALGTTILTSANASSAYNVGVGRWSLISLVSGVENVALGNSALGFCTADSNAAGGHFSLGNTSSGNRNTGFGNRALTVNTSGNKNTGLGAESNVGSGNLTNAMALGFQAVVNASNKTRIGNAAMGNTESQTGVFTTSDGRFKTNVSEADVKGLAFINRLRPVVYNFDTRKFTEFLTQDMPEKERITYLSNDFAPSTAMRQTGFIAQEVEKAAQESGYNFSGVHKPETDKDNYSIAYDKLVVPLVKAVQELDQQKVALQQKVQMLEKQVQELMNKSAGATGVPSTGPASDGFAMDQNIPNPFSSETTISYNLPQQVGSAALLVYDLSGKQIASFPITEKGASSITLTSEKLAAGIYIYSIMADGRIMDSKRMVVAQK